LIEVIHLSKSYNGRPAVCDVSFTVPNGQICGFLGPNGAGKSTTMNIITGCLAATSGTVRINGFDVFENPLQAKRCMGYLPEQPPLYTDMTAKEYLYFIARAKGIARAEIPGQLERVMKKTQLTDVSDRLIRNLSKGYRQRVGIAQAILGDPEIIILDEPTVGLDPSQMIEIRELIRSLGLHHTVILSSHILSEVRAICDTVIIMSGGKIMAHDTIGNLEQQLSGAGCMEARVRASQSAVRQALAPIAGVRSLNFSEPEGGVLTVVITDDASRGIEERVSEALVSGHCGLLSLKRTQASLEEVFLELTGRENQPQEGNGDDGNL